MIPIAQRPIYGKITLGTAKLEGGAVAVETVLKLDVLRRTVKRQACTRCRKCGISDPSGDHMSM